jgi:hypothetical protein
LRFTTKHNAASLTIGSGVFLCPSADNPSPMVFGHDCPPASAGSRVVHFERHSLDAASILAIRERLWRFRAKWNPVRVKRTRQIKNMEPFTVSVNGERL